METLGSELCKTAEQMEMPFEYGLGWGQEGIC